MSASVASDRANIRKRGTLLAYIFSSQGWGSFVGSLVTIIVLLCYKHVMDAEGQTSKVDGGLSYHVARYNVYSPLVAWRIVVGLSLIPALGTLYQRLTLPESTRYLATQKLQADENTAEELKNYARATEDDRNGGNISHQPIDEKKPPVGLQSTSDASANEVNVKSPNKDDEISRKVVKKAQFRGMSTRPRYLP